MRVYYLRFDGYSNMSHVFSGIQTEGVSDDQVDVLMALRPIFRYSDRRSFRRSGRCTYGIQTNSRFGRSPVSYLQPGIHGVPSCLLAVVTLIPEWSGFHEIFLQQSSSHQWIGQVSVAGRYLHPQLSRFYL